MSERLASDIIECDGMLVVKLYVSNVPKETVEEEMRLTSVVRECGIRAPQVRELIEDSGRWGFSYEKLEGPTYLDLMAEEGCDFEGLGRSLALLHRDIHEHSEENMPALKDRLRATIEGSEGRDELRKRALEVLAELPDGDSICHGDFHPGNVIVTDKGEYVLDWIDASAGHNLADVARTMLLILVWLPNQLRSRGIGLPQEDIGKFHRSYRAHVFSSTAGSEELLDRWMFPVAVARLCQAIPGEEGRLLEIIGEPPAADRP
jgi:Ser/Thr protein kinase RdoA (MazF antagonist)